MSEHGIILSTNGEQIAHKRPIANLVKRIWDDPDQWPAIYPGYPEFYNDADIVAQDFLASPFFNGLRPSEQLPAYKALELLHTADDDQPAWLIEGNELTDVLFPGNAVKERFSATPADSLLLAGAAALDIERLAPGFLTRGPEFGFHSILDFASFMGAAVLASERRSTTYELDLIKNGSKIYTKQPDGRIKITTIGADGNGDFRLSQHEEHRDGAVSPLGRQTQFAPRGEAVTAGGYHHVEMDIMIACLMHMYQNAAPSERQILMQQTEMAIHKALSVKRMSPDIMYGDFGVEEPEQYFIELEQDLKMSNKTGGPSTGFKIRDCIRGGPGNVIPLFIYSTADILHFVNAVEEKVPETESVQLDLAELPEFIAAMVDQANQATGRTDPTSLLQLISVYEKYIT